MSSPGDFRFLEAFRVRVPGRITTTSGSSSPDSSLEKNGENDGDFLDTMAAFWMCHKNLYYFNILKNR